jgi:tricorn protease
VNLRKGVFIFISIFIFLLGFGASESTLMITQPAVNKTHIVFSYANDLWVTNLDGSNPRRLTSVAGIETSPFFSPDGKLIAFSGNYDGNTDVYLIPVEGGVPKRLTWHPSRDIVRGFSLDGKQVIFVSAREAATRGRSKLYSVPLKGGYPIALELPFVNKLTYSPDGDHIAYVPYGEVYNQWKNYRGGTHTQIWIFSRKTKEIVKIPQPDGRCNDTDPFWVKDKIYFRSDRNGEFNLFFYNTQTQQVKQLTQHKDFPILSLYAGGGNLVYEQAGRLVRFNTKNNSSQPLLIKIASDLKEIRSRYSSGPRFIRSGHISPTGARAVFGYRGEVVTVPAKKGDPRNLTNTTSVHERFPAWSPDGKSIAYFSDATGEYQLNITSSKGSGKPKSFKLPGAGFYANISWSPDSQKLCFTDNARNIFWMDVKIGNILKIDNESHYTPGTYASIIGKWSHDSNWIAYHLTNTAEMSQIYVYSLKTQQNRLLTDGLSDISGAVFDPSGKYLYFLVSTDAGPIKHWFDMSNSDKEMSSTIYLATLQKDTVSPLAKENDEEEIKKEDPKPEKKGKDKSQKEKKKPELKIDFTDLERRIIALPLPRGSYYNLQIGKSGEIYYLEFKPEKRSSILHRYSLEKRKDEVLGAGIRSFQLSNDNKKMLVRFTSGWSIVPTGKIKPGTGKLDVDSISVRVNPKAEWPQIFNEAWRVNRDYFYDPNMHGANWNAMYKKYSRFLPHLSCRRDLNRLIQWLCSELAVGHHRGGGGEFIDQAKILPGGLLGADYEIVDNRYRFKKVYGGLNWNPKLRSPLTEPGVNVKAGEFLIGINGKTLIYPENIYKYFENTAGKIVELTIGSDTRGTEIRKVNVVPVDNEFRLRNRDWVEKNLAYVTKKTSGRVAYVYVPNTAGMGHVYFKRYFYPQSNRDAIIVDERFNGGGQVADYYIDMLKKTYICSWAYRYGEDLHSPSSAIFGPKVLLINEMAGSGGDLFPWMWRQAKLGKMIGTRTWGGLVGVLGFPILMDGGRITAPNIGFWTEKEGFSVENEGVAPDIRVEQTPKLMIAGKDPQLDRAIKEIMKELKKNPPRKPKRPPFPIRVRK